MCNYMRMHAIRGHSYLPHDRLWMQRINKGKETEVRIELPNQVLGEYYNRTV